MFESYAFYVLFSSTITRIGAVLLLIFGVQILINLYRYNLRLAAFYDARADALELLDGETFENLSLLVVNLAPDKIDFGKAPKTPVQEITGLAETIANIRQGKSEKEPP